MIWSLQDVGGCSTTVCPVSVAPPSFMEGNWPKNAENLTVQFVRDKCRHVSLLLENSAELFKYNNKPAKTLKSTLISRVIQFVSLGEFNPLGTFNPSKGRVINRGVIFHLWYCFFSCDVTALPQRSAKKMFLPRWSMQGSQKGQWGNNSHILINLTAQVIFSYPVRLIAPSIQML